MSVTDMIILIVGSSQVGDGIDVGTEKTSNILKLSSMMPYHQKVANITVML